MKTKAVGALIVLVAALLAAPVLMADRGDDFRTFQKAVKQNPVYEAGKEVKWFKVLITDAKRGKDTVKITLPLALVEALFKCAGDNHVRLHDLDCDVDFRALFAELKKEGPASLLEITDDGATIKIWLE
jgi:hypothetical protein